MDGNIAALANAGLHLDQPLQLRFIRSESETWVSRNYRVDEERATDAFNAFLRVRDLHREAAFLKAGKRSHAKAAAMGGAAAGADALRRADVERLVALLCDKPQIEEQVDLFMERFEDPESPLDTPISRDRFLEVLEEEAASLRLSWCEQLFFTCDEPTSSIFSLYLAMAVMLVIVVSSIGFIFSSEPFFQVPSADGETPPVEWASLQVLEAWCMIVFSVEYVARVGTVWAVREHLRQPVVDFTIIFPMPPPPEEEEPSSLSLSRRQAPPVLRERVKLGVAAEAIRGLDEPQSRYGIVRVWHYGTKVLNLIDLVAILPFYLELLFDTGGGGLGVLRILRLARVFRLFKFGAIQEGVTLLSDVMQVSYPSLRLLGFFGVLGCVLFGSLIFLCELGEWVPPGDDDSIPEGAFVRVNKFGTGKELTPFISIPRSMWWVVTTATTVGYGDLYPTTLLGKVVATVTMLTGILVLALPITIISSNFSDEFDKLQARKEVARQDAAELQRLIARPPVSQKSYKGCLTLRLEQHLGVLLKGSAVLYLLESLTNASAVSEAFAVAVAKEVLGLMARVARGGKQTKGGLAGVGAARSFNVCEVDTCVQLVLVVFKRTFKAAESPVWWMGHVPGVSTKRSSHPLIAAATAIAPASGGSKGNSISNSIDESSTSDSASSSSSSSGSSSSDSTKSTNHDSSGIPLEVGNKNNNGKGKGVMEMPPQPRSVALVPIAGLLAASLPLRQPTEDEEYALRHAFLSFVAQCVPAVSPPGTASL